MPSTGGVFGTPVFGEWRPNTPTQSVTPGFWSKPLKAAAPEVRLALLRVIDETARKLQ